MIAKEAAGEAAKKHRLEEMDMKKLIAALLLMAMVLSLGSVAFAKAKFTQADVESEDAVYAKFTGNLYAYNKAGSGKTSIIVKKGSSALVVGVHGKNWVRLLLTLVDAKGKPVAKWFRTDKLKVDKGELKHGRVIFSSGGSNMSTMFSKLDKKIAKYKNKTVKTTGKVNLRKTPSLKGESQGVLPKGKHVKLTGIVGMDNLGVVFFQVKHHGKKYFVSEAYLKVNATAARNALLSVEV